MSTVSWDDVDPRPEGFSAGSKGGSGGGKSKYLKLSPGEHQIRPIDNPKQLRRYFINGEGGKKFFAISDQDENDCIIMKKYRDADGEPLYPQRSRYAFNCIDRADGNLKIVEVSPGVARFIRDWGKKNKINPGSGKGADFCIKVMLKSGDDPRNTKYEVIPMLQSPFTPEELAKMEKDGIYDLDEEFKITPQNEIEAKLGLVAGAPSQGEFKPKVKNKPQAAPVAAVVASTEEAGGDIPF